MAVPIQDNNVRLSDRFEALDREVKGWATLTRKKLMLRLLSLGIDDKIELAKTQSRIRRRTTKSGQVKTEKEDFLINSLASRLRKRKGDIESVAFSFARHGIFLERGVGKYRPKGSAAASKAAKPWIAPTLEPSIEELANILEEEYADIAAASLRIVVPGVMNTTVKKS